MEHFKSLTIFQSKPELSCIICSPWLNSTSFLIRPVTAVVWNQWSYVWFFRKIVHVLRCFTDVDITSTSIKHTVRNFEYQTDPKTSVGTGMPQIAIRRFFGETLYHQNQSAISVIWILKTWNFCPLPLISRFKVSTILFLALIRFPPTPFVLFQIFFLDGFHYRKQFLSSAYRVSPGPTSWNSFFHSFRIQFFCLNDQAHFAWFTSRGHLRGSSGAAQG